MNWSDFADVRPRRDAGDAFLLTSPDGRVEKLDDVTKAGKALDGVLKDVGSTRNLG